MAKIDLTLSESKSSVDLTLEGKDSSQIRADMTLMWENANGTWGVPLRPGTLESKTKDDLSLESK